MSWLKTVVLDLICTALIVVFVLQAPDPAAWVRWFVIIYTPFMLVLKLAAVSVPTTQRRSGTRKKIAAEAPAWFFHVVYGVNVVLLGYGQHWWLAGAWLGIWVLSVVFERRSRPAKAA